MNFFKQQQQQQRSLEQDQEEKFLVATDKKYYNSKCLDGNWPSKQLLQKVSFPSVHKRCTIGS
jgi:hypothetical protein